MLMPKVHCKSRLTAGRFALLRLSLATLALTTFTLLTLSLPAVGQNAPVPPPRPPAAVSTGPTSNTRSTSHSEVPTRMTSRKINPSKH